MLGCHFAPMGAPAPPGCALLRARARSLCDGAGGGEARVVEEDLELAAGGVPLVDVGELGVRDLAAALEGEVKGVVPAVRHDAGYKLLEVALGDRGGEVRNHRVVVRL